MDSVPPILESIDASNSAILSDSGVTVPPQPISATRCPPTTPLPASTSTNLFQSVGLSSPSTTSIPIPPLTFPIIESIIKPLNVGNNTNTDIVAFDYVDCVYVATSTRFRCIIDSNNLNDINIHTIALALINTLNASTEGGKWAEYRGRERGSRPIAKWQNVFHNGTFVSFTTSRRTMIKATGDNANGAIGWVAPGLFKRPENDAQECFVVFLQHVSVKPSITLSLPQVDAVRCKADAIVNEKRPRYVPSSLPRPSSDKFKDFVKGTIVEKLCNVEERETHFVGWMHFKHEDMSIVDYMQNWLWIYGHQTRTVYVKRIDWTSFKTDSLSYDEANDPNGSASNSSTTRSTRMAAWSPRPLRFEPWALDGQCSGKFVKQIGLQRFDCQRAKERGDVAKRKHMRTRRTQCRCHLNARYLQVFCDKDCTVPHGDVIIEVSDNHAEFHDHDLSWGNRNKAPLPRIIVDKFEDLVRLNPNFQLSLRALDRYVNLKEGFRADMETLMGYVPSIKDLSIAVRAQAVRMRYIFNTFIGYYINKGKADQEDFIALRDEIMADPDRWTDGDLFFILPYKVLGSGECCEDSSFPVIEIVDAKDKNKTIRYQPFVAVYQSQHMRNFLDVHGKNICSIDSTFGTTRYGFKLSAGSVLNELRNIQPGYLLFIQHETIDILSACFEKVEQHMATQSCCFNPKAFIMDKCSTEHGAVQKWKPGKPTWLCTVHTERIWNRALPSYVGKKGAAYLKLFLEKMSFVQDKAKVDETKRKLLQTPLLKNNAKLRAYLDNNWFNCIARWCLSYREFFHDGVDTTNMSESLFFSFKSELKHAHSNKIRVVFDALFNKLRVLGQQAELRRYDEQAITVDPELWSDLERLEYAQRPRVISELRTNKFKSKTIEAAQISKAEDGDIYIVRRKKGKKTIELTLSIVDGYCSCHDFKRQRIPCVDMYAVLRIYGLPFSSLPAALLNEPHLLVQNPLNVPQIPPLPVLSAPSQMDADADAVPLQSRADGGLPNLPKVDTMATRCNKLKLKLIEDAKELLNLCYLMEHVELEPILDAVGDGSPQRNIGMAYSQLLALKPKDAAGNTIYRSYRLGKRSINKSEMYAAAESLEAEPKRKKRKVQHADIPMRAACKKTAVNQEKRKEKRRVGRLRKPPSAMLDAADFEAALKKQSHGREELRKGKIARREKIKKQAKSLPATVVCPEGRARTSKRRKAVAGPGRGAKRVHDIHIFNLSI